MQGSIKTNHVLLYFYIHYISLWFLYLRGSWYETKRCPLHPAALPVTLRPPCLPFTKLGFNSVGWGDQTEIKSPLCVARGGGLLTGFYYSGG